MSTTNTKGAPTEAEILSYDNVPVTKAAAFIGSSPVKVRDALIQRRAPYGYAVENEETGTWTFQISPGLLVKYKNGELQAWSLDELTQRIAEAIDNILDLRAKAAVETLCPGLLSAAQKKSIENPAKWANT